MNAKTNDIKTLANTDNQLVINKAAELYNPDYGEVENFKKIFYFVRDEINFGFPDGWDYIPASETIRHGIGYCNSKSILLQALCKLNKIPVRLRAGQIKTVIMKGVFPFWAFPFVNETASHLWVEVKLDNRWYPVDAYILDYEYYIGAKDLLSRQNLQYGYALGDPEVNENGDWNEGFLQTNALAADSGIWPDALDYYESSWYTQLNSMQKMALPMLKFMANQNIKEIRQHGSTLINTKGMLEELELVL